MGLLEKFHLFVIFKSNDPLVIIFRNLRNIRIKMGSIE